MVFKLIDYTLIAWSELPLRIGIALYFLGQAPTICRISPQSLFMREIKDKSLPWKFRATKYVVRASEQTLS